MNNDLIKKIKSLKKIEPSANWMNSTRNDLISYIKPDKKADFMVFGFFQWLKEPQSFALALCLLVIFLGGPWLTIEASQASLPGDLLYSVKKITEGVQTTVVSDDNKTQLKVEFASRRLEELNKISDDLDNGDKAKQVASELKDNLAEASIYAGKMSTEEAIIIVKKTKKIREELDETMGEASLEVQNELAEAEKAVEEINEQILTSLNKKYQEISEGTSTTTDQEILIFLEELDDGTITTTDKIIK